MKKLFVPFVLTLLCVLPLCTLYATEEQVSPVQVTVLAEKEAIRPGTAFWVRVELTHDSGWHTYWKNPGEIGAATTISWKLPKGFEVVKSTWSSPQAYSSLGEEFFGYEGKTHFFAKISVDPKVKEGRYSFTALVSALACSEESCYPVEEELTQSISISKAASTSTSFFSPPSHKVETAEKKGSSYQVELSLGSLPFEPQEIAFVPATEGGKKEILLPKNIEKKGSGHYVFSLHPKSVDTSEEGLLVFSSPQSGHHIAQIAFPKEADSPSFSSSFFLLCFFAFTGGALLKLMPCVLPVIALKILSFVKLGGENPRKIALHGAAFCAGVIASFWALAAVLLLLKAYGTQVGWGFQLQNPYFLSFLSLLIFTFSLSLLGVFEIGTTLAATTGQGKMQEGLPSSFFSGVLATLVATPCTGPFLGPAIGAALTLPFTYSFTLFTMIALGLCSPYLVLSFSPGLIRFVPKPGQWTHTFKELCGFIMLLTLLWLLWVFDALTSSQGLLLLLAALLIVSFAAYLLRTKTALHLPRKTRRKGFLLAVALFIGAGFFAYQAASIVPKEEAIIPLSYESYSKERLQAYLKQGKHVFVDFTAKWCLVCQANKMAIHSKEVQHLFQEKGVVLLVADWTKQDAILTQELAKYGRGGVPLYLLFSPEQNTEPQILPQVLTAGIIKEHVEALSSTPFTAAR
jgi:thiol:disulfide interchange protein